MDNREDSDVKRCICFGCWLQAGVLATVENGKVVKLKGEPDHPVNQGWICERSKAFIEHLYHKNRLNYPLKRVGNRGEGRWERISWDNALDEIAEKDMKVSTRNRVNPKVLQHPPERLNCILQYLKSWDTTRCQTMKNHRKHL
jgi:anaerobic selenocysteine-containing dehydrogenase